MLALMAVFVEMFCRIILFLKEQRTGLFTCGKIHFGLSTKSFCCRMLVLGRNFADSEEDRNHHGPLPDLRMPDHINLVFTYFQLNYSQTYL